MLISIELKKLIWRTLIVLFLIVAFSSHSMAQQQSRKPYIPESPLAKKMLSNNINIRENALDEARRLSIQGKSEGVDALKEAIRAMAGNPNLEFPGFRKNVRFTREDAEKSQDKIIMLLRENRFLDDIARTKHLILMNMQLDQHSVRLATRVDNELGDSAYHQLQIVIEWFTSAAKLRKASR